MVKIRMYGCTLAGMLLWVAMNTLLLAEPIIPADDNSATEQGAAQRLQSSFIWMQADVPKEPQYMAFRKTFDLEQVPSNGTLRIFADVRYVLWMNGQYVERGPCRFNPKRPEYDILDVTRHLRSGRNVISVLVQYPAYKGADDFPRRIRQSERMMTHRPGLTMELKWTLPSGEQNHLTTDDSWRCSIEKQRLRYSSHSGSMYEVIDARQYSGDWTAIDFDDASWTAAVMLDKAEWQPLYPRSIPLLREQDVVNLTVVDANQVAAEVGPLEKQLPLELSAGSQLVIDGGREMQAYSVMDFDADGGSKLEIAYAARFYDTGRVPGVGRTPENNNYRRVCNVYTARQGRQTYMTADTYGCKYISIRVVEGRIKLHHIRVVDRLYPFERLGRFASNDETLDRIWQIGVRTIEVCSEDAYVDCADEERGQWMADGYKMGYLVSRVALAGPGKDGKPCYADGRLLRNMLRHVAYSQFPDGRLQPLEPANYSGYARHGFIADYTCLWVMAVAELYYRDGNVELARELWPVMVKAIDHFLQRRTERGLVYDGEFVYFSNPLAYVKCEGATLNAYFYRALRDAAELGKVVDDPANAERFATAADELRAAYNHQLWDEQAGTYRGGVVPPALPVPDAVPLLWTRENNLPLDADYRTPPTAHAALMALYYDVVLPEQRGRVYEFMQKKLPSEPLNPYVYAFYLETLYRQDTPEIDLTALKTIRDLWTKMTSFETGTTCELFYYGSFVHEAGAHPSYFLSSYVLGVRTDGPRQARELVIDPRLGDLERAEGTTLTEFGPVDVLWRRDASRKLSFTIDNRTTVSAILSLRIPGDKASLTIDEKTVLQQATAADNEVRIQNGRVYVMLSPGRHSGSFSNGEN